MFKGMPKVFWVAMAMIYGWFFLFFFLEITVKGFPLIRVMGIPACFIYNGIIACWLLNMVVAVMLFLSEEKREERVASRQRQKRWVWAWRNLAWPSPKKRRRMNAS